MLETCLMASIIRFGSRMNNKWSLERFQEVLYIRDVIRNPDGVPEDDSDVCSSSQYRRNIFSEIAIFEQLFIKNVLSPKFFKKRNFGAVYYSVAKTLRNAKRYAFVPLFLKKSFSLGP